MPRHSRLFLYGAIFHVYCRAARGEFVFDDEVANSDRNPAAKTFDGRRLVEEILQE